MREPRGFRRRIERLHGGQLLLLMFAIVAVGLPASAGIALTGLDHLHGASALNKAPPERETYETYDIFDEMWAAAERRSAAVRHAPRTRAGMISVDGGQEQAAFVSASGDTDAAYEKCSSGRAVELLHPVGQLRGFESGD